MTVVEARILEALLTFFLTAAAVEQKMPQMRGKRSGLLPVATAICGNGHGKIFQRCYRAVLSCDAETYACRNCFTSVAVAVISFNDAWGRCFFGYSDGVGRVLYDTIKRISSPGLGYQKYIGLQMGALGGFFHTCIDARDNIFDHCLSRSSAPTTPARPNSVLLDR